MKTNNKPVSKLRQLRHERGLSMEVLAVKAGITMQTLRLAEVAPELMTERTAALVAKALKLKPEDLR